MESRAIQVNRKSIPVQITSNGTLASAGQAGGAALDIILEGVQGLISNTISSAVTTVFITFNQAVTEVEIVLTEGRAYRSSMKKLVVGKVFSDVIQICDDHIIDPVIREQVVLELRNECIQELTRNLRKI
jgi:hypothetical protein